MKFKCSMRQYILSKCFSSSKSCLQCLWCVPTSACMHSNGPTFEICWTWTSNNVWKSYRNIFWNKRTKHHHPSACCSNGPTFKIRCPWTSYDVSKSYRNIFWNKRKILYHLDGSFTNLQKLSGPLQEHPVDFVIWLTGGELLLLGNIIFTALTAAARMDGTIPPCALLWYCK